MLMEHRARGYVPERVTVDCDRCHGKSQGIRWTDAAGRIVNSWGFIEFERTRRCYRCLDEGYYRRHLRP